MTGYPGGIAAELAAGPSNYPAEWTYADLLARIERSRYGNPPLPKRNTRCHLSGDDVVVTLHSNPIARLRPDGSVTVADCGWRSVTTKDRVNRCLPGLVRVVQRDFAWYWTADGWRAADRHPWRGGATFAADGTHLADVGRYDA